MPLALISPRGRQAGPFPRGAQRRAIPVSEANLSPLAPASLGLLVLLVVAGCGGGDANPPRPSDLPPDWSRSAVWYQIFVERFSNGDPTNDPTLDDIDGSWPHIRPDGWRIKPWTSDWYGRDEWERTAAPGSGRDASESVTSDGFYRSVQLRRYGGDLQGVIDRLDHIQSLGVTAIYLNPINDAPSLHKFDARNYRHVDRNFGPDPVGDAHVMASEDPADPATWRWTSADSLFLRLIDEVHARDMRVIVDYSWNHTGMTFWAFRDVVEKQQDSPYADWYRITRFDDPATADDEFAYHGWAGVRELPEFAKTVPNDDYGHRPLEGDLHPGPQQLAFGVTRRWLDPNGDGNPSDGVDGFRLDVAEMVPLGFWRDYRAFVKSMNPDAFLVGEVWWEEWPVRMHDPGPYLGDVFDAVMHYRWYMPTRSWIAGAGPPVTAESYGAHVDSVEAGIPRESLEAMMNVAATHDSPRLATSLHNRGQYKSRVAFRDNPDYDVGPPGEETRALQRVFLVQQFTWYGAPHIWAGDELGMWGGDDPDNRKPVWWPGLDMERESTPGPGARPGGNSVAADTLLLDFHRRLGRMRSEHAGVLARDGVEYVLANADRRLLAYTRGSGAGRLLVILNAGGTTLDVDLTDYGFGKPREVLVTGAASIDGPLLLLGTRSAIVLGAQSSEGDGAGSPQGDG